MSESLCWKQFCSESVWALKQPDVGLCEVLSFTVWLWKAGQLSSASSPPISQELGYSGERSEPGLKAWICVKCLPKSILAYLEYHLGHGLHYYIIFAVLNAWSALRRKQEAQIVPRTWAGEHFLRSDKAGLGSCHFSQGDLGRSPSLQTASCMLGKMKWLWHVEG